MIKFLAGFAALLAALGLSGGGLPGFVLVLLIALQRAGGLERGVGRVDAVRLAVDQPESASREINTSEAIVSMTHLYHRTQYANIAHGNLFAIRARSPDLYPPILELWLPFCRVAPGLLQPQLQDRGGKCRRAAWRA